MSETTPSEVPTEDVAAPAPSYGAPMTAPTSTPMAAPQAGVMPMGATLGAPGKVRSTGLCILLAIVTFGIYSLVWFYKTHDEMKRHSGQGMGGALALILAFFVGIVMPYLTSGEVGGLYERAGRAKPVSATTGLWYFPGAFILIGPLVWFVKTNGALNDYWKSVGAA